MEILGKLYSIGLTSRLGMFSAIGKREFVMNENKELTKYCYDNEHASEWLEHLSQSHFSDEVLSAVTIENAVCVPDQGMLECFSGGVYDFNRNPVEISFQRKGYATAGVLAEKMNCADIDFIDEDVVYLGQYRRHYGSFLVDSISRLWYALKDPGRYRYVYLLTQPELGESLHETAYCFLEHLGIKREQVMLIKNPTRFTSITIPEMSFVPHVGWHQEFLDTVYKVVDAVDELPLETHEKVYFSRSKFSGNSHSDFGEEFIVRLFEQNGFYIVYPEEHSLDEQIYIVNHCKVFASVGGSCAHNIIFSKVRPKMILMNRMNGYQWHQWMLDEMAGVEPITYVDAYNEPYKRIYKTKVTGPFLYWINLNVRSFADDYGMKLPQFTIQTKIKIFLKYSYRVLKSLGYALKNNKIKKEFVDV